MPQCPPRSSRPTRGRAKALHATADGYEHVVDLLAPGDLFGGLKLLGSREHGETVRAMTTMCALRVDTDAFRRILLEHPEVRPAHRGRRHPHPAAAVPRGHRLDRGLDPGVRLPRP